VVHHKGAQHLSRILVAGMFASAALLGCASVLERSAALPTRHAVVLDQLVIHSDFRLQKQDRILDDLRAVRESVKAKLAAQLPNDPIHVYLFENEKRFTGYLAKFFPDFPTRRAFFVERDSTLAVYAHWGDRVAEDLRHEVAHGYLHSAFPAIPLWLDEGLAEYFETPRGDSGLNRPHVTLLNSLAAQGAWQPNLTRLEAFDSVAHMEQVDYAESWAWVHLLLETIPARRELLQNYLRGLRRDGPPEPLSAQVARSMAQPDQVLREHLAALDRMQKP